MVDFLLQHCVDLPCPFNNFLLRVQVGRIGTRSGDTFKMCTSANSAKHRDGGLKVSTSADSANHSAVGLQVSHESLVSQ